MTVHCSVTRSRVHYELVGSPEAVDRERAAIFSLYPPERWGTLESLRQIFRGGKLYVRIVRATLEVHNSGLHRGTRWPKMLWGRRRTTLR